MNSKVLFRFLLTIVGIFSIGEYLFAQKEPAPCGFLFSATEQLVDCKLRVTLTALECLDCTHTWNISTCGPNQTLTGNSVTFSLSNINTYTNPQIIVQHSIDCASGSGTGFVPYSITTPGIFLGIAGDFSTILPATTLVSCNDGQPLLIDLVQQKNVYVLSTVQIDKPNQAFNDCNVCMDPGTGFIVGDNLASLPKKQLNIKNTSDVHNAFINQTNNSPIWQGIDVERSGILNITDSGVKGALVAVRIKHPHAAITFEQHHI